MNPLLCLEVLLRFQFDLKNYYSILVKKEVTFCNSVRVSDLRTLKQSPAAIEKCLFIRASAVVCPPYLSIFPITVAHRRFNYLLLFDRHSLTLICIHYNTNSSISKERSRFLINCDQKISIFIIQIMSKYFNFIKSSNFVK